MKKGFTLIELLAVIIILAIIALIATPIILNIIVDSKEEANKRSIDNYAKAIENSIVKYQLSGKKFSNGYYKSSEDGKLITLYREDVEDQISLNIEYEGNPVKCDIIKFNKDNTLHLNKCKVNGEFIDYEYGTTDYICVASKKLTTPGVGYIKDPKDPYKLGTEYICKVNAEQQHTFYVLGVEGDKINLIMDRNILNTGEGTTSDNVNSSNDYGHTPWLSSNDYKIANIDGTECLTHSCSDEGPITAMNYLYESTKNWTNIPNINFQYDDENGTYGGIYTSGNITSIKNSNNNVTHSYNNLKARMPRMKELGETGCVSNFLGKCPEWLINALREDSFYNKKENIKGVEGYWTSSSYNGLDPHYGNQNANYKKDLAYYIIASGLFKVGGYCCNTIWGTRGTWHEVGIRPVISVSYLDIS